MERNRRQIDGSSTWGFIDWRRRRMAAWRRFRGLAMVHSVIGWTRGVQIKLWDLLRTLAIYLSALEMCSQRGAMQIHVYIYLSLTTLMTADVTKRDSCNLLMWATLTAQSGTWWRTKVTHTVVHRWRFCQLVATDLYFQFFYVAIHHLGCLYQLVTAWLPVAYNHHHQHQHHHHHHHHHHRYHATGINTSIVALENGTGFFVDRSADHRPLICWWGHTSKSSVV